jgi:hypothetical protein
MGWLASLGVGIAIDSDTDTDTDNNAFGCLSYFGAAVLGARRLQPRQLAAGKLNSRQSCNGVSAWFIV